MYRVADHLLDNFADTYGSTPVTNQEVRKQNHSEIEKRRREKMNMLIRRMALLVPMCRAITANRKLDKLTVLRMTVQHIKAVKKRSAMADAAAGHHIPTLVTEGFLFVVSCDRGKILYVSNSVKNTLNYNQRDLLGMSWFDVLHHKDIPKVKEQLSLWESSMSSASGVCPKDRLIDAKTLLTLGDGMAGGEHREGVDTTANTDDDDHDPMDSCPGSRRSFYCRMKYKFHVNRTDGKGLPVLATPGKRRRITITNDKYCDLYCTGYLMPWIPAVDTTPMATTSGSLSTDDEMVSDFGLWSASGGVGGVAGGMHTGCLVAMARVMPQTDRQHHVPDKSFPVKPHQYASRHSMDGMYLFVDQRYDN
ncbi:unnamed protein product, partial [Medioppia subpectinata]